MSIPENTIAEYVAATYVLGRTQLLTTDPMNVLINHMSGHLGVNILGAVLGGAVETLAAEYRNDVNIPHGEGLYVQELFDCWEETREEWPHFYQQSLQFINCALNDDSDAAAAVWQVCITPTSSTENDRNFITRLIGDIQHLFGHITDMAHPEG